MFLFKQRNKKCPASYKIVARHRASPAAYGTASQESVTLDKTFGRSCWTLKTWLTTPGDAVIHSIPWPHNMTFKSLYCPKLQSFLSYYRSCRSCVSVLRNWSATGGHISQNHAGETWWSPSCLCADLQRINKEAKEVHMGETMDYNSQAAKIIFAVKT